MIQTRRNQGVVRNQNGELEIDPTQKRKRRVLNNQKEIWNVEAVNDDRILNLIQENFVKIAKIMKRNENTKQKNLDKSKIVLEDYLMLKKMKGIVFTGQNVKFMTMKIMTDKLRCL